MDLTEKHCTKCKRLLPFDEFYKDKSKKIGIRSRCKKCCRESEKKAYIDNPEKRNERRRRYYSNNSEKCKQYVRKYHLKHREEHIKKVKDWILNNPERHKLNKRKSALKYRNTLNGKLHRNIRQEIVRSLHANKNGRSWENLVGYNCEDLKKRLMKTMPDGYTWDDYMEGKLHIDHKIPISVFNFKRPEDLDFKHCWALSNLQFLPVRENLIKRARIDKPFQPSLILGA